jgi:uncharacterized membrane protein
MTASRQPWNDQRVETIVGNLLRAGVLLSAAIVSIGGIVYLFRHGMEGIEYKQFQVIPEEFRTPVGIVRSAWHWRGRG